MTGRETQGQATGLAAAALTHEQWRTAAGCLCGMVARRVEKLAGADEEKPLDEGAIRMIGSLVLTARRVMELEDRYEQKVQGRAGPAGSGDVAERFDALARAAGLRIVLADDEGAQGVGGDAQ